MVDQFFINLYLSCDVYFVRKINNIRNSYTNAFLKKKFNIYEQSLLYFSAKKYINLFLYLNSNLFFYYKCADDIFNYLII